jgi:hypothetical protein
VNGVDPSGLAPEDKAIVPFVEKASAIVPYVGKGLGFLAKWGSPLAHLHTAAELGREAGTALGSGQPAGPVTYAGAYWGRHLGNWVGSREEVKALPVPRSLSGFMSIEDAARYDEFWQSNAPMQSTPCTRITWRRISGRTGRLDESTVVYDYAGRQLFRIDWTDHLRPADHSNPHLHVYLYGPQYNPFREILQNLWEGH